MPTLERLIRLSRAGDTLAARRLHEQARRRGDLPSAILAASTLDDHQALIAIALSPRSEAPHLETISAALGFVLTHGDIETLAVLLEHANQERDEQPLGLSELLQAAARVRRSALGIERIDAAELADAFFTPLGLAVRTPTRILVGASSTYADGASPGRIWPALQPWQSPIERNHAKVVRWADTPTQVPPHCVALPLLPLADAPSLLRLPTRTAAEKRESRLALHLAAPPTRDTFAALGAHLRRWPKRGREQTLVRAGNALAAWPDEERVVDETWAERVAHQAPLPGDGLGRHLELLSGLSPETARKLATQDALSQITVLRNGFDQAGTPNLAALYTILASPRLNALRTLELSISLTGEARSRSPRFKPAWSPSLRELTLMAPLDALWLRVLAACSRLETLTLSYCELRAPLSGLTRALARQTRLHRAHIELASVTPDDHAALFALPNLATLRHLAVDAHGLEGLLANTAALHHLSSLSVLHAQLGPALLTRLARAPHLAHLRDLDLSECGLDDEGLEALVEQPVFQGLERIDLSRNALRSRGVASLLEARFPELREVILDHNRLGRRGGVLIARSSQAFPRLERLSLKSTYLDATARKALRNAPHLEGRIDRVPGFIFG